MSAVYSTDFTEDFPPKYSALLAVNGEKISSIAQLSECLYNASSTSDDKFMFTFKNTSLIAIIDKNDVRSNNKKIAEDLGFAKMLHKA
jgi:hypothetical protein